MPRHASPATILAHPVFAPQAFGMSSESINMSSLVLSHVRSAHSMQHDGCGDDQNQKHMNFYVFYETDLVEYESECAGQCVTTPDAELESAHWGALGPCSWLTGTVAFATSLVLMGIELFVRRIRELHGTLTAPGAMFFFCGAWRRMGVVQKLDLPVQDEGSIEGPQFFSVSEEVPADECHWDLEDEYAALSVTNIWSLSTCEGDEGSIEAEYDSW